MKRIFYCLIWALLLTACGSTLPPTPQTAAQAVYLAEGDFTAALSVATKYKALPDCSAPAAPVLCSKASVVSDVQKAANTAWALLQAAQATVTDPKFHGSMTDQAVVSAQNAVGALKTIVDQLKVQ